MNKTTKYIVAIALVLAFFLAFPLIIKGAAISIASIMVALVLTGVFLLGICVALAVTSPLWIPFLAGWAAVMYCKKYHSSTTLIKPTT